MFDNLSFCLGELLTNSKKANTKRVYFLEQKLDINDEMQYQQGMISFKSDMLSNLAHYLEMQKQEGLYIKLILQLSDDGLRIEIRNNSLLTKSEKKRILEKLRIAEKYEEPQQAVSLIVDQTEGAGLGIIIIILMLRKIGLSRDNYKVFCTENETVTQMLLPLNKEINEQMDALYETFIESLKTIPVFEGSLDNFAKAAQNATDEELINLITKDISFSAVLLKSAAAKGFSCSKISKAFQFLDETKFLSFYQTKMKPLEKLKKSLMSAISGSMKMM